MQIIYETQLFKIHRSIFGMIIENKDSNQKILLTGNNATLFNSIYEDNLQLVPPSAVDSAMDDLCECYTPTTIREYNNAI